jgi:hypothetical protein
MMNDLHMRRQLAHSLSAEAILERADFYDLFAVARWVRVTIESIFVLVESLNDGVFKLRVCLMKMSRSVGDRVTRNADAGHLCSVCAGFGKFGEGFVACLAVVIVEI